MRFFTVDCLKSLFLLFVYDVPFHKRRTSKNDDWTGQIGRVTGGTDQSGKLQERSKNTRDDEGKMWVLSGFSNKG